MKIPLTQAFKALAATSKLAIRVGGKVYPIVETDVEDCAPIEPWSSRPYEPGEFVVAGDEVWCCAACPDDGQDSAFQPLGSHTAVYTDGYAWRKAYAIPLGTREKFGWAGVVVKGAPGVILAKPTRTWDERRALTLTSTGQAIRDANRVITGVISTTAAPWARLDLAGRDYGSLAPSLDHGALQGVVVNEVPRGFTAAKAVVVGDGVGAQVRPEQSGDAIPAFTVTDPGAGYTWAEVVLVEEEGEVVLDVNANPFMAAKTTLAKTLFAVTPGSVELVVKEGEEWRRLEYLGETTDTAVQINTVITED